MLFFEYEAVRVPPERTIFEHEKKNSWENILRLSSEISLIPFRTSVKNFCVWFYLFLVTTLYLVIYVVSKNFLKTNNNQASSFDKVIFDERMELKKLFSEERAAALDLLT